MSPTVIIHIYMIKSNHQVELDPFFQSINCVCGCTSVLPSSFKLRRRPKTASQKMRFHFNFVDVWNQLSCYRSSHQCVNISVCLRDFFIDQFRRHANWYISPPTTSFNSWYYMIESPVAHWVKDWHPNILHGPNHIFW